jgi:enoyl-CoA hydratase
MSVERFDMPNGMVYVEREPPLARVVLNRPEQRNPINYEMFSDLSAAFGRLAGDDDINAIIIKGEGPSLSGGGDLRMLEKLKAADAYEDRQFIIGQGRRFYRLMWDFPKPIIVKAHGHCLGGGFLLVGGADLVVADEEARFGLPEARNWGFDPFLGMWVLTLGVRWAKALLFTGDSIDGRTAERLGMINKAVPADQLDGYVEWLAARVAKVDRCVLSVQKEAVNSVMEVLGIDAMMRMTMVHNHLSHQTPAGRAFLADLDELGPREAVAKRDAPFGGPQRVGGRLPLVEGPPPESGEVG